MYMQNATMTSKPGCRQFAVDLGTAKTAVYAKDAGIVLREPSMIEGVHPLQRGVIADYNLATDMLRLFLRWSGMRRRGEVLFCVPSGATEVEKRAVYGAAIGAGVKTVRTIAQPMAAAIGAGLAVGEATGCMVVNIGAGVSEAAVISLGDIVASRSTFMAGNSFDEAIISALRKKHNLCIDQNAAEDIKRRIGAAFPCQDGETISVQGQDVTAGEIRQAFAIPLNQILTIIDAALEKASPEHRARIALDGITLTGGGALLRGLKDFIAQETGIPAYVAENAPDCAINGAGKCLANAWRAV